MPIISTSNNTDDFDIAEQIRTVITIHNTFEILEKLIAPRPDAKALRDALNRSRYACMNRLVSHRLVPELEAAMVVAQAREATLRQRRR